MNRIKEFTNIILHKMAFFITRNNNGYLKNNISLCRAIMHDSGKAINVLLFGDKIATSMHRRLAGHHKKNMNQLQKIEAFCDWESARMTKKNKPLNGAETWVKYYNHIDMACIVDNFYNQS